MSHPYLTRCKKYIIYERLMWAIGSQNDAIIWIWPIDRSPQELGCAFVYLYHKQDVACFTIIIRKCFQLHDFLAWNTIPTTNEVEFFWIGRGKKGGHELKGAKIFVIIISFVNNFPPLLSSFSLCLKRWNFQLLEIKAAPLSQFLWFFF